MCISPITFFSPHKQACYFLYYFLFLDHQSPPNSLLSALFHLHISVSKTFYKAKCSLVLYVQSLHWHIPKPGMEAFASSLQPNFQSQFTITLCASSTLHVNSLTMPHTWVTWHLICRNAYLPSLPIRTLVLLQAQSHALFSMELSFPLPSLHSPTWPFPSIHSPLPRFSPQHGLPSRLH